MITNQLAFDACLIRSIYKSSVSTDQTMDTHLFYVWLAIFTMVLFVWLSIAAAPAAPPPAAVTTQIYTVCIYGLCSEAALKHNAHKARLDLVHTYGRCNTCTVHTPIEAIRGGSRKIRYNVQIWNIDNHIMMSMLMAHRTSNDEHRSTPPPKVLVETRN